jgi:hypothetical protein
VGFVFIGGLFGGKYCFQLPYFKVSFRSEKPIKERASELIII